MKANPYHLRQELAAFVHTMFGMMVLVLVLTGIGGTIYKVIAPDGWVAQAFGRSLSAGVAAVGSLMLIGGLAWFSRTSPRKNSTLSDFVVYGFAAAGLLYLARVWITGSL